MEKLSEYQSLNHDQKIFIKKTYICLHLVSKHNLFHNWCQDTIGLQRGHWLRGSKISKKLSWIIKMFHFERWSEYGYVSLNEFFMSFSSISKSFKTHIFRHITIPPIMNWGGARKLFKISDTFKPDHISLPKMFFNVFKSIEIQNLKGFDILDQGRECDLNMKSDKKWSFWTQ